VPYTGLIDNPLALASVIVAFAVLIAVIRAKREELPEIVRALMRMASRDDERNDKRDNDDGNPPSLSKPLRAFLLAYLGYELLLAVNVDSDYRVTLGTNKPQ
jgi:hypothetical protein